MFTPGIPKLNYYHDAIAWHRLLHRFCNQEQVAESDQTPFFWWLSDHNVLDIDYGVLAEEFEKFKQSPYCMTVYN